MGPPAARSGIERISAFTYGEPHGRRNLACSRERHEIDRAEPEFGGSPMLLSAQDPPAIQILIDMKIEASAITMTPGGRRPNGSRRELHHPLKLI
ncbi:MAG: hypothetical protein AAF479_09330 [Pseudomonadota bacterium]